MYWQFVDMIRWMGRMLMELNASAKGKWINRAAIDWRQDSNRSVVLFHGHAFCR